MKKYGIELGLLIILVSGICFSCGYITQPEPEIIEVEKIVYVDKIVIDRASIDEAYIDGYNDGIEVQYEISSKEIDQVNKYVENRDQEWIQAIEYTYQTGYNDGKNQDLTDIVDILSAVGFLLI